VVEEGRKRVPTPKLNQVLEDAARQHPPGLHKGHRLKFYYITQTEVSPPTFVLFANRPDGVHFSYLRYLENRLREGFGFEGNPVRIFLKRRRKGDDKTG
jgi:GTP-binding protein